MWVRLSLLALVCACAGAALYANWTQARGAVSGLPLWVLPAAALAGMADWRRRCWRGGHCSPVWVPRCRARRQPG